ncbi:hypothetical protein AB0K23_29075 [Streptomyces sp. NPDC049602]|uniref:hypothetical protein n=1 Tax=Streptomyces sp. NPDC049602 TaxID=3155504 RepID=UPI0034311A76
MSALAAEPQPDQSDGWEDLVRRWKSMDWPEGCKVEIIGDRHRGTVAVRHPQRHRR